MKRAQKWLLFVAIACMTAFCIDGVYSFFKRRHFIIPIDRWICNENNWWLLSFRTYKRRQRESAMKTLSENITCSSQHRELLPFAVHISYVSSARIATKRKRYDLYVCVGRDLCLSYISYTVLSIKKGEIQ